MKKRLSFQREILERIDYFNYLDPESLCKMCKNPDESSEKESKKEDEKTDSVKTRSNVKRYSKPVNIRRYLQYSNAISE